MTFVLFSFLFYPQKFLILSTAFVTKSEFATPGYNLIFFFVFSFYIYFLVTFREHAHRLSQAITTNPNKVLKRIDLSKNQIEEKGNEPY